MEDGVDPDVVLLCSRVMECWMQVVLNDDKMMEDLELLSKTSFGFNLSKRFSMAPPIGTKTNMVTRKMI